jgi:signal transduction histidine kinase
MRTPDARETTRRTDKIAASETEASSGSALLQSAISRAEAAERRLNFLADVSHVLAGSLDVEANLQRIAEIAVRAIADVCFVDLQDDNVGAPREPRICRIAAAADRPDGLRVLDELDHRFPPDGASPHPVTWTLRTGQPVFLADVTAAAVAGLTENAEHARLLERLGIRSQVTVPLSAAGRTIGALTFLIAQSGRRFAPDDLRMANEVAERCALAVDYARVYRVAFQSSRMRDDFLAIAAHELKTPLTSLRGFAQLEIRQLERSLTLDPDRVRRAFQVIERQSLKLTRLVGQMLDASQLAAGQLNLERSWVDLAGRVEKVVELAQTTTSQHTITLRAAPQVKAFVDPNRLEQVVSHLIDNAIRYSPDGGPIEVELERRDPATAVIAVRDHGLGVAREHRSQLFDRFYQAHPGDYRSGIGIGLYLCRRIAELHGGTLVAEFPTKGGIRFRLTLPLAPPEPMA